MVVAMRPDCLCWKNSRKVLSVGAHAGCVALDGLAQCRFGSQVFLGGIGLIGSANTTTKSNKYQIDSMNKKN
jgi:hypothetical protein